MTHAQIYSRAKAAPGTWCSYYFIVEGIKSTDFQVKYHSLDGSVTVKVAQSWVVNTSFAVLEKRKLFINCRPEELEQAIHTLRGMI